MAELAKSVQYVWALSVVCECILFVLMLFRKQYRVYPAFFSYLVVDTFQAVALFTVYKVWGFASSFAMHFGWATQAVVLCSRALAVAELCRNLLRQFKGIWALAWRLLILSAGSLVSYSVVKAGWKWDETVLRMNIGLEFTIIAVITLLFVFARYYEVVAARVLRTIGTGFFVLSTFKVVNDTILQHRLAEYVYLWRLLGLLAFLVSLFLWFLALNRQETAPVATGLLPSEFYWSMMPAINERLRHLNEMLNKFFGPKS